MLYMRSYESRRRIWGCDESRATTLRLGLARSCDEAVRDFSKNESEETEHFETGGLALEGNG